MTDVAALSAALDKVTGLDGRAAPPRFVEGRASLILDVTGLAPDDRDRLEDAVRLALAAVPGVTDVRTALTAEKPGRRIVAVASGKGGVGKSTIAANLAVSLARAGMKVGLVDADIYGPSQPKLLDVEGTKPTSRDKRLVPVPTAFGVPLLSTGQLVEPGKAVAWRGPMAAGALKQLLDADWGDTELLIVDLPPGTGDVQMSMIAQHKPVGAVIVSTPQDLALIDAARAIDLFEQAGVPIIGIVENMAGYACPHCGEISDPFGSGGAEREAAWRNYPFIGRVPLDIAIRTASDAGRPLTASNDPHNAIFDDIARAVQDWLGSAP